MLRPHTDARQATAVPTGTATSHSRLTDSFGRQITYLRLSVTDRCDLRCVYCMSENMSFLPRHELLTLEELDRIASAFIERGVTRLRVTGGEPLVRKNVMSLFASLSRHLESGCLDELTLTTNGSQLSRFVSDLKACGVKRINVSLDSLNPAKFKSITRWGDLSAVLDGVAAAERAKLALKFNVVVLKGVNEDEIASLVWFAHRRGADISFIEAMPLGDVGQARADQYVPMTQVRDRLEQDFTLEEVSYRTGGPARYVRARETGGRIGFITPMTHNFCETCNRVRMTATGTLYMCLGQEHRVEFRDILRSGNQRALDEAINQAMADKPRGHDFVIGRTKDTIAVPRHMSITGG